MQKIFSVVLDVEAAFGFKLPCLEVVATTRVIDDEILLGVADNYGPVAKPFSRTTNANHTLDKHTNNKRHTDVTTKLND